MYMHKVKMSTTGFRSTRTSRNGAVVFNNPLALAMLDTEQPFTDWEQEVPFTTWDHFGMENAILVYS